MLARLALPNMRNLHVPDYIQDVITWPSEYDRYIQTLELPIVKLEVQSSIQFLFSISINIENPLVLLII